MNMTLTRILLALSCLFSTISMMAAGPHVRIIGIWAYDKNVTDFTLLDTDQNNLRFYFTINDSTSMDDVDFLIKLEGHDDQWRKPYLIGGSFGGDIAVLQAPQAWYFYTNLQPGDYVCHVKARRGKGEWGEETRHAFTIDCPWWRTGWAYLLYAVATLAVIAYILYLIRARIRLNQQLAVEKATSQFRTDFIIAAMRQLHTPLTIIQSTAEKFTGSHEEHLTRTDIQHLRNSSRQLRQIAENLMDFEPTDPDADYRDMDDVLEMADVPINDARVLLMVPNQALADLLRRDLSRFVVVHVQETKNGFEHEMVEWHPEVVIIDTEQNDAAYDIIHHARQASQAWIIVISDFNDKQGTLRILHSEADDFLRKPFNSEVLTAMVIKRLRSRMKEENEQNILTAQRNGEKHNVAEPAVPVLDNRGDKAFLDRLDAKIGQKLSDEAFDVNSLAEAMKMSRGGLYNKTKQLRGMTPVEYLRWHRLRRAAELLQTTNLTITAVQAQVGMPDTANFYRRFKEQFGVTPSKYRCSP